MCERHSKVRRIPAHVQLSLEPSPTFVAEVERGRQLSEAIEWLRRSARSKSPSVAQLHARTLLDRMGKEW